MEKYLRRCLDSLIIDDDGMKQLEVLVINDGSKDASSQIAHEYQEKYPETFRVVDKDNGNYGSCINRGLKEASGKYTKILDADDCYYKENIPEFISLLKNSKADIVFSPYGRYTFDSVLIDKMQPVDFPNGKILDIAEIQWSNPVENRYRIMHCMAVSTTLLKANNYQQIEGISYTDNQFVFYSFLHSKDCTFFDKPIYKYYFGREGQTMSKKSLNKSYMHFYKNARVMMDAYMTLPETMPKNKQYILFQIINQTSLSFSSILLTNRFCSRQQLKLMQDLIDDSKKCRLWCPLADFSKRNRRNGGPSLRKHLPLYLWKEMHVPSFLIYFLSKIRFFDFISKVRI